MITFGLGHVEDNEMIESKPAAKPLRIYMCVDEWMTSMCVWYVCSRACQEVNALARLTRSLNEACKLQLVKHLLFAILTTVAVFVTQIMYLGLKRYSIVL